MVIEETFEVAAAPETVYAYLLDVEQVMPCMPGAELVDTIDDDTFRVRVKVKVGPITARYDGTATIVDRDHTARRATIRARPASRPAPDRPRHPWRWWSSRRTKARWCA